LRGGAIDGIKRERGMGDAAMGGRVKVPSSLMDYSIEEFNR